MTKRTEKIIGAILLSINAAAMAVTLTYAVMTIHHGPETTYRKQTTKPVQYQTLNLLDYQTVLEPDPDPVSPAPVIEQWEPDPYIRAYQAGKYANEETYEEGAAEEYIPLDKAIIDLK